MITFNGNNVILFSQGGRFIGGVQLYCIGSKTYSYFCLVILLINRQLTLIKHEYAILPSTNYNQFYSEVHYIKIHM